MGVLIKINSKFSIIELMTVVLIILLLISLTVPSFLNLKTNARTAICKSNLRQIGTLITSYQSDNSGYLPNDDAFRHHADGAICPYNCGKPHISGDIPNPSVGNNAFYQNWNGHLLPYMDVHLPDKYTRFAMVTKVGTTRFSTSQLGGPANPPPADVLKNGWIVIDDALRIGGYNDLKVFICPEIHQNTFDVAAALTFNNVRIPRIQQLSTNGISAFKDIPNMAYGMGGGVPTTYLANKIFFGEGIDINSHRIDEIAEISQKALLIEGGIADTFGTNSNGAIASVYYTAGGWNGIQYDGGDLTSTSILFKTAASLQKLNYVHDNQDQFWIMNSQMYVLYFPNMNRDFGQEVAAKFNSQFSGKAYMASGTNSSSGFLGYSIVSFIYPGDNGETFAPFFKSLSIKVPTNYLPFIDEPNDFKYLTGNMNVLMGDGSAATQDQAWLCNNRRKIALFSKE